MTATGDRSGRDAKWRDPNTGKQRSKTFRLRRDAASYGARMEAAKAEGRYLDPLAGKITFKGHGEGWRERQLHRPRTATEVERMLRLYVYPRIGNKSLGAIRPSEIEALVKACSSTLAPNTIRVLFGWVRSIFRAAVRDRLIAVSPCEGVKLPPAERPKVTPPGPSLVAAMADAIDPRYRALILLGAGSGVRISEALAVSIDRDRLPAPHRHCRSSAVARQRSGTALRAGQGSSGQVEDDPARIGRARRPGRAPGCLRRRAGRARIHDYVGPAGRAQHLEPGPAGGRRSARDKQGRGVPSAAPLLASALIAGGESVKVIQERLGHTSAVMTLDVYGHLWPSDDDRTRAVTDAALAKISAASCSQNVRTESR